MSPATRNARHGLREHRWLILISVASFVVMLGLGLLWYLDRLHERELILGVLAAAALSDVVTVVVLERIAPTRVTVGPNESDNELAEIVQPFHSAPGGGLIGEVRVRGELWQAISRDAAIGALSSGQRVRIIGRDGLRLEVAPDAAEGQSSTSGSTSIS